MTRDPERPARPEQPGHGFEEGLDREPDSPDERRVGRLSEGEEALPDTPASSKPAGT
jgi:hypothetical protein